MELDGFVDGERAPQTLEELDRWAVHGADSVSFDLEALLVPDGGEAAAGGAGAGARAPPLPTARPSRAKQRAAAGARAAPRPPPPPTAAAAATRERWSPAGRVTIAQAPDAIDAAHVGVGACLWDSALVLAAIAQVRSERTLKAKPRAD